MKKENKNKIKIAFIVVISLIVITIVALWILWPIIKTPINGCDWPAS